MDEARTPVRAVHCCACSRLIAVPDLAGKGYELRCPFCATSQRLAELTVLVSEPLVKA
ncbi:MAG: hypothetical protein M3R04_02390 [bacterium]|nr:hypothetical protein [bacterium]